LFWKLAHKFTPIEDWPLPKVPNGFQISLKRDDLTGSSLSGCKQCDLNNCTSNVLLDRIAGAQVYLVPCEPFKGGLLPRIDKLINRLWEAKQERALYLTPAASPLGTFGYIELFHEMINQGVLENYTDVVLAVATGGTIAGLSIANFLTGSRLKIHGMCVLDSFDYFHCCINELLQKYGFEGLVMEDICDVMQDYKGMGFAKSTDEELELLLNIAQSTGVILDPAYTLKAVRGMLEEMEFNPSRFKGKRVLFLHTGGIFSLLDGKINDAMLQGHTSKCKEFKIWTDAASDPLGKPI